jgi:hypothetical protein
MVSSSVANPGRFHSTAAEDYFSDGWASSSSAYAISLLHIGVTLLFYDLQLMISIHIGGNQHAESWRWFADFAC